MTVLLRLDYMRVHDLPDALDNVKDHDEDVLRGSILRWGFVVPLTIDERTGRLLAGHGRRNVIAKLEHDADPDDQPPPYVQLGEHGEWLIPVSRGVSTESDDEAEALALSLNYTQDLGGYKQTPLAERLRELHRRDRTLTLAAGFTDNDVRERVAKLNVRPPRTTAQRVKPKLRCPRCKHEGVEADFKQPEVTDSDPTS